MSIILRQKLDEAFDHIIRRAANTDLNSNVDNCTADEVQVSVEKGDKMTALSIPKRDLTIFGQQLRRHSDKDTFICEVQIIPDEDVTIDEFALVDGSVINVVERCVDMEMKVECLDGRTILLDVRKNGTIMEIEKKIRERVKFDRNVHVLEYRGVILGYDDKMEDRDISEGSVIRVVKMARETMRIFAKLMDGMRFDIAVTKSDTIIDIKKKIQENIGLSPDEQKLVYHAQILEDDETVDNYQMANNDVINVVVRLRGTMRIFAKTTDGKTVAFEVSNSDTIIDIKKKIKKKTGLSPDEQTLHYQGLILDDDRKTVNECGIVEKCVINVETILRGTMIIYAKTMNGKTVAFEVSNSDTIIYIKKMIQEKTGLSPYKQILQYQGLILNDDRKTVNECGIVEKCVINVEARLRGGMMIYAKTMDGKTVAFEVTKSDTIIDIKKKIKKKTGLSSFKQQLVYKGRILNDEDDTKTVEECQIDDCSVVSVVTKSRDVFHINIKMVDCRLVPLIVTSIDTVLDIKWMIRGIEGHLMEVQLLKVGGRILHDDSVTVLDCGILTGGTITVSIKESLTIYILTFDMETVPMKVYTSDRVIDMKKSVKVKTGLSVEDQIFVHRRKIVCVDRDTMERYRFSGQCDMVVTATLKNMDEQAQATLK